MLGAARSVEMGLTAMVALVVSWFVTEKLEWRSFGTTEGKGGGSGEEGKGEKGRWREVRGRERRGDGGR